MQRFIAALVLGVLAGSTVSAQVVNPPPAPEWIQNATPLAGVTRFTTEFEAPPGLLKAILLVACESSATIELNHRAAGESWGRERASGFDVTTLIVPGKNHLAIRVRNEAGAPLLAALLELNGDHSRQQWVATSASWTSSRADSEFSAPVRTLGRVDSPGGGSNPFDPKNAFDAYNSWKLALGAGHATDPTSLTLLPGFKATLIRSASSEEGSWVALAFDPKGRLTLAREKRGLLRLTLAGEAVERVEVVDDSLLECRGLLYAHGSLYANANNAKVLVRLRDADGDDRFDEREELLRTTGGVGHGRNHLKLGPDGCLYVAHGNNVRLPESVASDSPLKHYGEDQVIPCPWDPSMFDGDTVVPAGHVLRLDPRNRSVHLFAGGFRNPMDVAFDADGELFTFDADMELDLGTPWYMPNRVLHVVPGADFGFRRGTGRFPSYYADTLPAVTDIGLASPTAVTFGSGAAFPKRYQDALFIADWAYGRILAVHLRPEGASYGAEWETFAAGRPLNVTDLAVGPDHALWFITGGRGTQSGLYRLAYVGDSRADPIPGLETLRREREAGELRALRRQLERLRPHVSTTNESAVLREVWPHLGHSDRWIRHAARGVLESIAPDRWRERVPKETDRRRALTASLALARIGSAADRPAILSALSGARFDHLATADLLDALRIYGVVSARLGPLTDSERAECRAKLEPHFPSTDSRVNHELCELLVWLNSNRALPGLLTLLAASESSEDIVHYLFFLRYIREGWTLEARRQCMTSLARAKALPGGQTYFKVLLKLRDELLADVTAEDRAGLLVHSEPARATAPVSSTPRTFVKAWRLDELAPLVDRVPDPRLAGRGREIFLRAQCAACHRIGTDPTMLGGTSGPDLGGVSGRFNRRDLLAHVLEPSTLVDEKFRQTTIFLRDGRELTGVIEEEGESTLALRENLLLPDRTTIPAKAIRQRTVSAVSPMPSGLLDSLTSDEVVALIAYLENQSPVGTSRR